MLAGGSDAERALGARMPPDVVEAECRGGSARDPARHDGRKLDGAVEGADDLAQVVRRQDPGARDETGLGRVGRRHDEPARGAPCGQSRRYDAGDRAQLAAERELAEELDIVELPGFPSPGQDDAERDREIETSAFLRNVGRAEMGRDAARGPFEATVHEGRPHAVAALAHGRRREPRDRECRQAARDVHLDADLVGLEPRLAATDQPRQAHGETARGGGRKTSAGAFALEPGDALLERLELLARALEHGGLQVEFLTRDEIHPLEPGHEQRPEVPFQVLAERAQILRHGLRQLAGELVDGRAFRRLVHCRCLPSGLLRHITCRKARKSARSPGPPGFARGPRTDQKATRVTRRGFRRVLDSARMVMRCLP